jgi:hypothetical protein
MDSEVISPGSAVPDDGRAPRDIKGHLLFEVATEVANRGMSIDLFCGLLIDRQLVVSTLLSSRKLQLQLQNMATDIRLLVLSTEHLYVYN